MITPRDVLKIIRLPRLTGLSIGEIAVRMKNPTPIRAHRSTYRTTNRLLAQGSVTLANGRETTKDDLQAMKDRVFAHDFGRPVAR